MESKWEPPEWIEEVDPTSGARYGFFFIVDHLSKQILIGINIYTFLFHTH